jgi:Domain of unknown function (DUF4760)
MSSILSLGASSRLYSHEAAQMCQITEKLPIPRQNLTDLSNQYTRSGVTSGMNPETIGVVQFWISGLGVIGTAGGLLMIYRQISSATDATRGQNTMPFVMGEQINKLREMENTAAKGLYDPSAYEQLDEDTLTRVLNDANCKAAMAAKLNFYEAISCAIEHGVVNEKLYQSLSSGSVRMAFWMYARYIIHARNVSGNANLFISLESVASRWDRSPNVSHRLFDSNRNVVLGKTHAELAVKKALHR